MNFNKVILAGRLTRDPELKNSRNISICVFNVAYNEFWTGADKQLQQKKYFFDVVTKGKKADNCKKYLKKGDTVLVDGKLINRVVGEGESQHTIMEIVAENVQIQPDFGKNIMINEERKQKNDTL